MTIHRMTVRKLAFSTLLMTAMLGSAHAQDTAVADRLKSLLSNQGVDMSWTGISGDDSSMVLEGVSIKPAAEKDALPIGNITLEGVEAADGGFTIDKVSTQEFAHSKDGVTLKISPFVMNDLTVPAEGSTDPMASLLMYKSAELEKMTVMKGDKTAFEMDNFTIEITPPADGKPMAFTGAAEKFSGDLSLVDDPKSKEVIDALGYQNVTGSLDVEGSWQPSDGKMELSKYDITVNDAGTFGMTFDIGGYTLDFVKSIQAMQKQMAGAPEGSDKSAQGMAMLGLLQQLTFNSASIRFDDDSLTNKVLDYVGKQQGMSAKDIANQAKALVPFGMAQLNNPELTAQVSSAINTYLDDPKSLEISAEPGAPVPFAMIMAGAMSNPLDLPKTLGVSVKANQD